MRSQILTERARRNRPYRLASRLRENDPVPQIEFRDLQIENRFCNRLARLSYSLWPRQIGAAIRGNYQMRLRPVCLDPIDGDIAFDQGNDAQPDSHAINRQQRRWARGLGPVDR